MSIFASRTTKTIPIPFDPPHTVTIQKLAGRHLEKAQSENQFAAAENLRRMGGPAFQAELAKVGNAEAVTKAIAEAQRDPLNGFDRYVIIQHGVKAWSYKEPVSEETLADLDAEAVEFLAREILRLSKPALFETEADAAEAQKKAEAPASLAG